MHRRTKTGQTGKTLPATKTNMGNQRRTSQQELNAKIAKKRKNTHSILPHTRPFESSQNNRIADLADLLYNTARGGLL